MRKLGMENRSGWANAERTRLKNQMRRLFRCSVSLIYSADDHEVLVHSFVADRAELWWDVSRADAPLLWESDPMIHNRKTDKCEICGSDADVHVVADGFDDAPASFIIKRTCSGPCEKTYRPMTAQQMHETTGLPMTGWSQTEA